MEQTRQAALEWVLALACFTAGCVDVLAFVGLGGVLISAMTGNLTLLALYLGQHSASAATTSVIALLCFMPGAAFGNLAVRKAAQVDAVRLLVGAELAFLLAAFILWDMTPHRAGAAGGDAIIGMLGVAMGVQSIVGRRINLAGIPTVVFTSVITNIVVNTAEHVANHEGIKPDTRRQFAAMALYFLGALGMDLCLRGNAAMPLAMPLAAGAAALIMATIARPAP